MYALRMFLIENGYFGDPDANSLHKLLVIAFRDFKSFQKERGIRCSQAKFVPNFAPWKTLAMFCLWLLVVNVGANSFPRVYWASSKQQMQGLETRETWRPYVPQGLQWSGDCAMAGGLLGTSCGTSHYP